MPSAKRQLPSYNAAQTGRVCMGRAIGFISIIIVAAIGFWIYTKQGSSASPGGNAAASPRATIDLVGVKNDLNAIAQAERRHYASDGKYVSLDDLRSNGDISMQGSGRPLHLLGRDQRHRLPRDRHPDRRRRRGAAQHQRGRNDADEAGMSYL